MSTSVSTTQLNLRIISIVVFTCICYLSIGLPLAVLPGYIHYQLGYSTFVAGIVISLQYISTLISRPHAGRYTDIWGPKKVVSLGIVCCLLSGAFTLLAVVLQATPMLAIAALLAGRVFLGVGELYRHRRHPVGDQNRRRDPHVTGYLLERRGDLCGDGGRGAAGSYPQSLFWHQRLCYGGSAGRGHRSAVRSYPPGRQGDRRRQSALSRGGAKNLALRPGAGLWHRRFRRYRHLYHPLLRRAQLAGRRVYPFAVQRRLYLRSPGAGKYHYPLWRSPGLLACFIIESLGLLLIWLAPSAWMAGVGAFLTGSGFSLVFPALGVEAVKQVEEQNQGTALGTYSAFLDLALGLTGPLAGWVAGFYDLATLYLLAAIVVALAFLLIFRVHRQQRLVARE